MRQRAEQELRKSDNTQNEQARNERACLFAKQGYDKRRSDVAVLKKFFTVFIKRRLFEKTLFDDEGGQNVTYRRNQMIYYEIHPIRGGGSRREPTAVGYQVVK